jgi:energy-coupling factor transporter ATP-binding protein EcfA2
LSVFPDDLLMNAGPTASGKSSLLHALLGEMHYVKTNNDSWFNLPREHGVAYAAQEAWVISGTVKVGRIPSILYASTLKTQQDNILFGTEFDGDRYSKGAHTLDQTSAEAHAASASFLVLYQCALEQDVSLWQAGDLTEVGEKGVTLRYASFTDCAICYEILIVS